MTIQNKQFVQQALDELFGQRDLAAIERHFAPDYRQHNPFVESGPDGLRAFAAQAIVPNPAFSAAASHVLVDGELVAVRSRYTGFGPHAHVGFDLFRLEAGKLAEHWDCLEEDPEGDAASFESALAGLSGPGSSDSERSRALVDAFLHQVLIARDFARTDDFLRRTSDTAALTAWCSERSSRVYTRLHRTVADGGFVLTQAEGTHHSRPHALYDLFFVSDGVIIGHWGAGQEVVQTASGLGMF